jgi:hypothetical protein
MEPIGIPDQSALMPADLITLAHFSVISQAGRDALARARFTFWALFNFLLHPAGSRKYGGTSCNPSVLRSYFAPA